MALRRALTNAALRSSKRGNLCTASSPTPTMTIMSQRRGIYSIWGTVCNEGNSLQPTSTGIVDFFVARPDVKSFQLEHAPEKAIKGMGRLAVAQSYLLSMIENDIERLMSVDWTVEFDAFWGDAVESHRRLYEQVYGGKGNVISATLLGDFSGPEHAPVKAETQRRLRYLESALKWAEGTERVYTAISNERFTMQREVFNAFEREKILAGCVDAVDSFLATMPAEFKRKATQELEWHLNNVRHWAWDCPNAKMQFTRRLA